MTDFPGRIQEWPLQEKDITEEPIMFGKGGILESSSITTNSYGWGMNVQTLE